MDKYDILNKASKATDPRAKEVRLKITTLDPDAPYPLHWDVVLRIPEAIARGSLAQDHVFDFLVNFNELLQDVEVTDQNLCDSLQTDRHTIEYEIIPEWVYSERATDFVNTLLVKHQHLLIEFYNYLHNNRPDYKCPYQEKDFQMDAMVIGNSVAVVRIKMPPVLKAGDMTRMYICHDENLGNVMLYTIRIDEDGDTCFMTWVDDSHYKNHGKFKLSEGEEIKVVTDFYMKHLADANK